MIGLYRTLFPFLLFATLPYYGWRMIKRGGYGRDFHHRFGLLPRLPARPPGVRRIWIQAVSVGELRAVQPILEGLHAQEAIEVVLTTTTSTGYQLLQDHYSHLCAQTGLFPLDWYPFSASAWQRIDPDVAILVEGEIWPEHIHQANRRGAQTFLANGRISDRSFRRYRKMDGLGKWLFRQLGHVFAASPADAERFAQLGVTPDRLTITGNVKFDVRVQPVLSQTERLDLRHEIGFAKDSLVILGSSTWPGEERFLLTVLRAARRRGLDARLLLSPRHAERRKEIQRELAGESFRHAFRSSATNKPRSLDVYVADTTGELVMLTQAADVAFIGKSLPPHTEGQTPIEAAALGLPIVYGPGMSNFRRICESLESEKVAWRVADESEATELLITLLEDTPKRLALAEAARQWHARNQGATQRILNYLMPELKKEPDPIT